MLVLFSWTIALAPYEQAVQRIWGFGKRGSDAAAITAAATRFASLRAADGIEATVYARAADGVQDGVANQATRARNEKPSTARPWRHVGSVATTSDDGLQRAVHAQRALIVDTARELHKPLRFLPSLSFAYAAGSDVVGDTDRRLGSYRCASCGTLVPAGGTGCIRGCEASPRSARTGTSPQVASVQLPSGRLTLAVAPKREAPLPAERCGFVAASLAGDDWTVSADDVS